MTCKRRPGTTARACATAPIGHRIARIVGDHREVDVLREVAYPTDVAVPAAVLKQLLMLDKHDRVELAHALLESVNDNDDMGDADRARLHAAIEQSIVEIEAGQTVLLDEALASLRARRAARASR